MRSVEEIQNLVFSAFEDMLLNPDAYMPCAPEEFEARLASYLWVLVVSEEAEKDWAGELEMVRQREQWPENLDVLSSLRRSLLKEPRSKSVGKSEQEILIEEVIGFYEEMAERMGFISAQD